MTYRTILHTKQTKSLVGQSLSDISEDAEIISVEFTDSDFRIVSKANSYNGFGLVVEGILSDDKEATRIDLNISTRHDFITFNVIMTVAFLIALFFDKVRINGQLMEFDTRLIYIIGGFALLATFDVIFVTIPWLRIRKMLSKRLG